MVPHLMVQAYNGTQVYIASWSGQVPTSSCCMLLHLLAIRQVIEIYARLARVMVIILSSSPLGGTLLRRGFILPATGPRAKVEEN